MGEATERSATSEPRRYRILDVIGRGGFGTVYRARLEGADGFYKDVAIKLLRAEEAPAEVLQRFRDEARILGLIRDRAIVTVDPPTRLAGRWAVVMEYVDGASAARLVRLGPLPPGAVMEIGEEIARALHKIYRHPGRDGKPLRLVHRDIKPANIQISPAGEVKLLDFGIARAEFSERESETTLSIGGTRGYIAPERLNGLEGAEGDVFSLGVVLHKLLTGELPEEDDIGWGVGDPEPDLNGESRAALLAYASKMRAPRPQDRPSARDAQAALAMLRGRCDDEPLSQWAERVVPEVSRLAEDELVGAVLMETLSDARPEPTTEETPFNQAIAAPVPARRAPTTWIAGGAVAALLLALGVGVGLRSARPAPPIDAAVRAAPEPVAPAPPVDLAPDVAPARVEPEPVAPEPVARTTPKAAPVPVFEEVAAPVTPPVGASFPVRITSIPFGARVRIDGEDAGATPQLELSLTAGEHRVELALGDQRVAEVIQVGPRLANRFVWRVEEGVWDAGF